MTAEAPNGRTRLILGLSAASFLVTVPHAVEDILYGVPEAFGLSSSIAALLLGAGFALQVCGIIGIAGGARWGLWVTFVVALGWFLGAVLDHLPDLLSSAPYRHGLLSRGLEALIIGIFASLLVLCGLSLRHTERSGGW